MNVRILAAAVIAAASLTSVSAFAGGARYDNSMTDTQGLLNEANLEPGMQLQPDREAPPTAAADDSANQPAALSRAEVKSEVGEHNAIDADGHS